MQDQGVEGIDEMVARLWPGRTAEVRPLEGGIPTANVLVTLDGGERYVLHPDIPEAATLGIDRRVEHQASLAADAVGVGPRVEAFLEPEACLVTRYIAGTPVAPDRMRDPATIRRVAVALRAFHNGPPLRRRFSSFEAVEMYRTTAFGRGAWVPPAYAWARQLARRIQAARGPAPERPCHNDLLNQSFVDDGSRIRIVDWEYAGMGDVFFDLALLAVSHDFGEAEHEALLQAYAGRVREEDVRALHLMRFMADFGEAMWGVVQAAISTIPYDFEGYAAERFARLEATAADAAFTDALGAV
jgi:thiamine kinase-like enzyme